MGYEVRVEIFSSLVKILRACDLRDTGSRGYVGCRTSALTISRSLYRAIGYPPLPEGAEGVSCGEHKDYGCWTVRSPFPLSPFFAAHSPLLLPTSFSTPIQLGELFKFSHPPLTDLLNGSTQIQ